jgi:hypothetical protein
MVTSWVSEARHLGGPENGYVATVSSPSANLDRGMLTVSDER